MCDWRIKDADLLYKNRRLAVQVIVILRAASIVKQKLEIITKKIKSAYLTITLRQGYNTNEKQHYKVTQA